MSRQIVLDTETTGLKPEEGHRIIEIGALELIDRQVTGNNYHMYINPQRDVDMGAVSVHGLTADFLKDKPLFSDIVDEFINYINGAELIIHNAPFDVGFINYEFNLLNKKIQPLQNYAAIFDTLALARKMHPGQRNSLDALCKRYNIDSSERKLHGALLDANLLAEVYLLMTGGQVSLFGDVEHELAPRLNALQLAEKTRSVRKTQANNRGTLPIVHATAKELAEHDAYLKRMREKNGKCIWSDE